MGLDMVAGDSTWHASYGGFANLRDQIAEAAGFDRRTHYEGRFTPHALKGYWIDPDDFDIRMSGLPRDNIEEVQDDIDYLLLHSDCDGILPPFAAGKVAARLSDLIYKIEDAYDRERAQSLVEFLREASEDGNIVEFA